MAYLLELTAMLLDTLPQGGRIMLLAVVLSLAFAGFARVLSVRYGESMHILYRKAVLIALLVVPALVWLFDIRMVVQVEEVQRFATFWETQSTRLTEFSPWHTELDELVFLISMFYFPFILCAIYCILIHVCLGEISARWRLLDPWHDLR